ncbi:diguanylate cyclase [Marinobacter daepoensis]|uniref:diguanylate cyclase n=1 Tax=Marinobacter daepoensis TaxID=262077 RepID=A0ABS3BEB1_9GAMM|nr:diguanylate cyclase [Marinobacter daepoensis]MBN7770175.1 diguanylate cyclase [Marinobacter daepoensis]MBY6079621.1 diguanylate cyclase [Marinobacter daepoensis]
MDSQQQDYIADRLNVLKLRFIERLRSELVYLASFSKRVRNGRVDEAEVVECYQRLHKLAGSAGTFGFPSFGEFARDLEKRLKQTLPEPEESTPGKERLLSVSGDIADRMDALIRIADLDNPWTTARDLVVPPGEEIISHGMQVRLVVINDASGTLEELAAELLRYGFAVQEIEWPQDHTVLETGPGEIAAVICSDLVIGSVSDWLEQYPRGLYQVPVPVICIGETESFERRYHVAEHGGRAFLSAPVDLPELVERVEALVQEQAASAKGRVMIVDDDRELAEHYCLVLESAGIQVKAVSDPLSLLAELYAFEPELLLMDIELGAHSGVTLARMIRFQSRWLSLPIVYLSSEDDPENQLKALSGGADEFLVKPISDDYLIRAVQMRCHRARQLSELMNRDSLTRLLKHSVIKQEVERERQRCSRGDYVSSVVLLDIDHFKRVNDTWGHGQGDVVIRTLANLLRNRLRESDALGRYGGEEFLLVLPHCEPKAAVRLMRGILESFSELEFTVDEHTFRVTFSAGVARINEFSVGDQIIEAADKALYVQKRNGRNGVTLYGDND